MEVFKKLKEQEISKILDANKSVCDFLVDSVTHTFVKIENELTSEYEYCLADCESPIEQILSLYLEMLNRKGRFDIPLLVDLIYIEPQAEIICNTKKYRVDFLLYVKYWNFDKQFVIECDGHEFHQKTKAQVERDNERMRNLIKAGYTVIRFSGSEIYNKPLSCANEIKKIIQAPAIELIGKVISDETKQS